MAEVPTSIVIPAFNQLSYCRQCIESLLQYMRPPYQLILVDNGSTDGVGEYFDSIPGATVIHAEKNLGFPAGANLGLRCARGHVVMLNSDVLVTEGWLERLKRALLSADDIGMAGPVSNYALGDQYIDGLTLRNQEEIHAFARKRAVEKAGQAHDVYALTGFCLLIRDAALAKVGLFDESFGIGNFEDTDYCYRMRAAGYRMVVAEDCFVFHYGGRTFEGMGLTGGRFRELMAENRQRYIEKWGLRLPESAPDEHRSLHLNARANEAFAENRPKEAVELLREAITICPKVARNYLDLGVILYQLGQSNLAFAFFMQCLQVDPDQLVAQHNLRVLAAELGRTEEVIAFLATLHPKKTITDLQHRQGDSTNT